MRYTNILCVESLERVCPEVIGSWIGGRGRLLVAGAEESTGVDLIDCASTACEVGTLSINFDRALRCINIIQGN